MILNPEERETHICTSSTDDEWVIYTTQRRMMNKLEKIGIQPYHQDTIDGEIIAKYYKVPLNYLSIRVKKKRELTEEQRKAIGERLNKAKNQNLD